jgi:tetratricopeptide (TPR) repeat protein
MRTSKWCIALLFVVSCGGGTDQADADDVAERVRLFDGLGTLHRNIGTRNAEAQAYFDQGLRLSYAFNHAEAMRSFREAQRLDPSCAMCWWGEAMALGPNINAAMDSASGVVAYAAIRKALALSARASEVDRGLIDAMSKRYSTVPSVERATLDSAYAGAMGVLARAHPEDDDVLVLYAESLMDLSPWDYWVDRDVPKPNGAEAISSLETVMARNPDHPGACHFFIHVVESMQPRRAIECAERLPALMPAAGHIVHMPGHIYIRVGRYADAVERNVHAAHADEAMLADLAPDGIYRLGYYPHNYHFLSFAADMAGMSAVALEAADNTAAAVDTTMLRVPDLASLQHYRVMPLYTQVRFGRWDEILAAPAPPADLAYMQGVWHFARGMAFARTGRVTEAEAELKALGSARADPSVAALRIWGINPAASLLEIGEDIVAGEIAATKKDWVTAERSLRSGVRREDALTYDEPPTWQIPVRHHLGAILLAAGRPADAEAVYREDLDRFPDNGWSLEGLQQSLSAQGKRAEADSAKARLAEVWAKSDVTLTGSRF